MQFSPYVDDIIIQTTGMEELQEAFIKIMEMVKRIKLKLNTAKCELISDESNDFVFDEKNGVNIMAKGRTKYLGQYIDIERLGAG